MNLSPEKRARLAQIEQRYFDMKRNPDFDLGDDYRAETYRAYTNRFGKKNPNTRGRLVQRGRKLVTQDPQYQKMRQYTFGAIGLLGLGLLYRSGRRGK